MYCIMDWKFHAEPYCHTIITPLHYASAHIQFKAQHVQHRNKIKYTLSTGRKRERKLFCCLVSLNRRPWKSSINSPVICFKIVFSLEIGCKICKNLAKNALWNSHKYAHARRMKRAARDNQRLKMYLGRIRRDLALMIKYSSWSTGIGKATPRGCRSLSIEEGPFLQETPDFQCPTFRCPKKE